MTETINLTARRWRRGDGAPSSHPAIEALEVAAEAIRNAKMETQHVIVIYGGIGEDGAANFGWTQAGLLDAFGQIGLLESVKTEMTFAP